MKKVILLLVLTFVTFHYSQEFDTGLRNLVNSKEVREYSETFKKFISERGIDSAIENTIQKTLGATLQVVTNVSSNNPTIEDTLRLLEKHIIIRLNTLPPLSEPGLKIQVTENIQIQAGDTRVKLETLNSAGSIINELSLPIIKDNLNLIPNNKIDIVLFSNSQTYGDALVRAGLPAEEILPIVSQTGGIAVNSSIWIPLYNVPSKADLANVLTHELTHVAFNQAGIGRKLPLWLNEGGCWYNGLAAQEKISPSETKLIMSALRLNVVRAAKQGKLLPLSDIEHGILNAPYNVEYQGYLATEQLIKKHGLSQFKKFLAQLQHKDLEASFNEIFKTPLESYEKSFNSSLK